MVAQIHEIDTTVEVGGWIGYEYIHSGRIPYRLRGGVNVMTNAGIVYGGARVFANGSLWLPVHPRVLLGVGIGLTWVSGSFNRTCFGVTPEDSAASALPVYNPGSGLQQGTGWLAAVYQIDKHWFAGAMIYMRRVTGSAADSPIVSQRGARNQLTSGAVSPTPGGRCRLKFEAGVLWDAGSSSSDPKPFRHGIYRSSWLHAQEIHTH